MILTDELKKIAKKQQTSFLNIGRDYLQALFLTAFYQQKEAAAFFFKGGTALHLLYQSPRFSEDLDFSAHAFDCWTFENLLENALSILEKNGLKTDLVESKKTTGGCLAIFSGQVGEILISVKTEVSLRKPKETRGEMVLLRTDFLPLANILTLEKELLVKEKINALLTRKKARDFFDAYFILRKGWKINLSQAEQKILMKKIELLGQKELAKDLKEFLPKSFWPIILDLPKVLKSELGEK